MYSVHCFELRQLCVDRFKALSDTSDTFCLCLLFGAAFKSNAYDQNIFK